MITIGVLSLEESDRSLEPPQVHEVQRVVIPYQNLAQ